MSLEFFRCADKFPESNKPVLIAYKNNAIICGQTISLEDCISWGFSNKEEVYWAYFEV